jgi:AcrR family transcriptional regulator
VNAVAKEAGVDKVLIYRYFGGMPELLRVFGRSGEFWPSFDEMTGGDVAALRQLPLSESIAIVMQNYIKAMRRRSLTQEILAWEAVERNELTQILENIREEVSMQLFKELEAGLKGIDADVAGITTLLAAAVNYLVVRSRTIRIFNTVDIRSDEGWKRLERTVAAICDNALCPENWERTTHG